MGYYHLLIPLNRSLAQEASPAETCAHSMHLPMRIAETSGATLGPTESDSAVCRNSKERERESTHTQSEMNSQPIA